MASRPLDRIDTGPAFTQADADALKTHSTAPAVAALFGTVGEHLDGAPDIKMLNPVAAGDPAKGQLRP